MALNNLHIFYFIFSNSSCTALQRRTGSFKVTHTRPTVTQIKIYWFPVCSGLWRSSDLKDESGGSLFMTVRIRVSRPFFPSHTRLLSVLTRASTSGMLAFMDMALSSFSSWLFSRRYLFLQTSTGRIFQPTPVTQQSEQLNLSIPSTACERHPSCVYERQTET